MMPAGVAAPVVDILVLLTRHGRKLEVDGPENFYRKLKRRLVLLQIGAKLHYRVHRVPRDEEMPHCRNFWEQEHQLAPMQPRDFFSPTTAPLHGADSVPSRRGLRCLDDDDSKHVQSRSGDNNMGWSPGHSLRCRPIYS